MPFAPIVLAGFESELFYCYKSKYAAKFMTICYDVKEQWVEKIPGVINQFDNTARIQIVDESNEPFYSILKRFYELKKIPALLNTSFNVHGEPIINKVEEAFTHLKNGVVDYLVVGENLYSRPSITPETIFEI
jgi:carbamoyltransferase